MRRFARLYEELDRTTSTNDKVRALAAYFAAAYAGSLERASDESPGGGSSPLGGGGLDQGGGQEGGGSLEGNGRPPSLTTEPAPLLTSPLSQPPPAQGGGTHPSQTFLADAAWAVYFLTGRRIKRLLPSRLLAGWALDLAGVPEWLFEESYASVGDLAETIALVLESALGGRAEGALSRASARGRVGEGVFVDAGATPSPTLPRFAGEGAAAPVEDPTLAPEPAEQELPLSVWVERRILPLRGLDPEEQRRRVTAWWAGLDRWSTFVLNKLLTGELRVGVSQVLVERALAEVAGVTPAALAHRLMGAWEPTAPFFQGLLAAGETTGEDDSRPYPFYLASPLEAPVESLGERADWQVEWKWDGIRAQLLRRGREVYLWSRGEELITERFSELARAALALLPEGTVIDGEILAWRDGSPLPFAVLQRRIGRKKLSEKILAEAPVVFVAYDLLEHEGTDARELPLAGRRAALEKLLDGGRPFFLPSPVVAAATWDEVTRARAESRERGVEGMMLKRLGSPYRTGRRKGDWWKWKIDPFQVDAVLVYAQAGHGRRANLMTDYTFAVWSGGELVPFAKAYSGLSDAEIRELDAWIRRHTLQKFGPVRSVEPLQVFEVAFEGIARSGRHRSGVAVRFPRIARWRTDKTPEQADTLEAVQSLIGEV